MTCMTRSGAQRPRVRLRDLRRVGLDVEELNVSLLLTCKACGATWLADNARRRGWRICPHGCNSRART
jgi:hypothetical protein